MLNHLSLDGTWKLRWTNGTRGKHEQFNGPEVDLGRWLDATVPGEVHLDLMRAGWIDDVYVGANVLAARWVEECYWTYRRHFEAPAAATEGRAWLVFEGLDYGATLLLNGREIGRHANVFYPCRIEVTGKLQSGSNLLVVHLESGLFSHIDKAGSGWGGPEGYAQGLHKRQWLRKPQSQFEWDWSHRLINVGIFKPVRLEWTSAPARLDQLVPLVTVSHDLQRGTVKVRQFIEAFVDGTEAVLQVELAGTPAKASVPVKLKAGLHAYEATLEVEKPKLWWPAGCGQPDLYDLQVTVQAAGGSLGQRRAAVGFRRVRVIQDPHPRSGTYFVLEVNNRKVFAKGGNLVPADMITANITPQRYRRLVELARQQHFNLLRVWGGGSYESDEFYELCDRQGIMVWQEFIFACSKYPLQDVEFLENVKREATWNIRRLACHPSLVVWCGNNEIEWANWAWGYDRQSPVLPDHALFHIVLPRLLAEEDPTRFYWPSSPYSPNFQPPNQDDIGDQHPWIVPFTDTDFRKYRQLGCRFPNEGGFLGATSLPTLMACLPRPQDQRIGSLAWDTHDNSLALAGDFAPCVGALHDWLGLRERDLSLVDFVYWSGLLQGEALHQYCDNFRRRMFDTASAVFWCYNDCWPAVRSWTTVDYGLRRTPAFHPVRRAMAPVHVVLAQTGSQVTVFGVNDTDEPVKADLRYGLLALGGGYPLQQSAAVTLAPNSSTPLASFAQEVWTRPTQQAAFAVLSQGEKVLARNRLILPLMKEMQWSKPAVQVRLSQGKAIFSSPVFTWGVCLDLDGEQPLADNFFDLYPGMDYAIDWAGAQPPKVLRAGNLARD